MKTTVTKLKKTLCIASICISALSVQAQEKTTTTTSTAAVISIDSKGLIPDVEAITYLVNLELEKTKTFQLTDKLEIADACRKNNIDLHTCISKTCIMSIGQALKVEKIIGGSVERFGEKIIVTLKVFDVANGTIFKQETTEYINLQAEIQTMISLSVKKLVGIETDQKLTDQLISYQKPINSPRNSLKLNGPRMGASVTLGEAGERLSAPESQGGFDMMPVTSQFGWQQEIQYMSSGNFQALIENIFLIGGLENGKVIPSYTLLNGFRNSKSGWEFAIGPTFRLVKKANGFYDKEGTIGDKGAWHLAQEWGAANPQDTATNLPMSNPNAIVSRLDSRGEVRLSTGLIIAVGKTFRSGYLNIPVNVYFSPRKDGWIIGASVGFNIAKKSAIH